MKKQVSKKHYGFTSYMTRERWGSTWHQINEILKSDPGNTLEIGPGAGVLKRILPAFGITAETLDIDPDLEPDHVGSATEMPFADKSYDVVCAFQMLEHLPYDDSIQAFGEMCRVAANNVIISLPDAKIMWKYHVHIPKLGGRDFLLPKPALRPKQHVFDGEHYWELNKKDYELSRVVTDLSKYANLLRTYRPPENLNHRFFVFETND